jgi:hypothetical protein
MVMIIMMISTSMTSISGVMFISIIGSGSAPLAPEEPTLIDMVFPFKSWGPLDTAFRRYRQHFRHRAEGLSLYQV